jgi:hypothetical protein
MFPLWDDVEDQEAPHPPVVDPSSPRLPRLGHSASPSHRVSCNWGYPKIDGL